MREVYQHEFSRWQRWLATFTTMWRINSDSIDFKWGYFAPRFGFKLLLHRGGYFNPRYSVTFCFIWGVFNVALPFKTKIKNGCSLPMYGVEIHDAIFWIHYGGKYDETWEQVTGDSWWTWDIPFFTWKFDGHWIKDKKGQWVLMSDILDSWEFKKTEALKYQTNFSYTLKSGKQQERTANFHAEKRQWHRKWFPFLKKAETCIDIKFSDEVGEESGSWKGGVIGCSQTLVADETPEEGFARMLNERRF